MIQTSPVENEEFIQYLNKLFIIKTDGIKSIISNFHSEMQKGLSGCESSLKMIPSFVDRPKGDEKGKFIALDLGGTNFRVFIVELDGSGNSTILAVSKFTIKKKDMDGTGVQLFDFIAFCIEKFLDENNIDRKKKYNLAFTFSFPVEQTSIASGKLIVWTKGFTAKGVEGEDVIILLNEALKRRNIKCIEVVALTNDTVGTLVARSYRDKTCDMGVIMGTGTNACYPEKLSNIIKWKGINQTGSMIVNMEWGNFNKLRLTNYDKELDKVSPNPGSQFFEKMVSGMFLGEITGLIICDMIQKGLIFNNEPEAYKRFNKKGYFRTEYMSLIEGDETRNLEKVEKFLFKNGMSKITLYDRQLLKYICQIVSSRAAILGATAISAVLTWIDPELKSKHTVAIDGSLFEKYPGFDKKMISVFVKLYDEKAKNIELVSAKDGSGKGAAIIAAVVTQKN